MFPIYWDDLTDEEKADGLTISLAADSVPAGEYAITVTPTSDWYAFDDQYIAGEQGAPCTYVDTVNEDDPAMQFDFTVANVTAADPDGHYVGGIVVITIGQ